METRNYPEKISRSSSHMPSLNELDGNLQEASKLVDDIILKNYLHKLDKLEIIPLDDDYKDISDIRIFKITEMVYQSNEYSTYKFSSVFDAVQNLNCGIFIIMDSDGEKTDFYMGIRSFDKARTTKSLRDTLQNALKGQFPGVKIKDLMDSDAEEFMSKVSDKNICSVSGLAKNKDGEFKDNESFIQGLEKLALAMQDRKYTGIILAKSTPKENLDDMRQVYETIYTQLSPFKNLQISYGENMALNVSNTFSKGKTFSTTETSNYSEQIGSSSAKTSSTNQSTSQVDPAMATAKALGKTALGVASIATAPLTGGASLVAAGTIIAGNIGLDMIHPKTMTDGSSKSESYTETSSKTQGESFSESSGDTETESSTRGVSKGQTNNLQLNLENKSLHNILERIDSQLERMDEFESLGMWESAAYFLSDNQEVVEMAAGTYKALIKGENSGVEASAINYWGRREGEVTRYLHEYITNFVHPIFNYNSGLTMLPVNSSTLVSSNELSIQMGLPRSSVPGFPVVKHADFGKEVVSQRNVKDKRTIKIGSIYTMGRKTKTGVEIDIDSLTMHSFITGSTGAGKSNTVFEILNQLRLIYNIPFMVIEPAKGEYKNIFGKFKDVTVYGTNPKKSKLLRINPFSFPEDIHVLEHLDRLVEIFNVCWPMYAAMPAILKEGMERAYRSVGWDLTISENPQGKIFPNFVDLLQEIERVIDESKYSADTRGDYSGALLTRVSSLTNGINGMIFTNDELSNEDLFDKSVIIDLSRVGSVETKSLIMGLLVMKLNEYRMASAKFNSKLNHITVLEEAHNLLRRTSTEQNMEGSNLLGKSVELLSNSIAEMRTYGEGFIISDQSPGLLDLSAIRNTNTKISLRLPDREDRELVGYASGLKEEQIGELAKLGQGVAAIYQNDWIEPVLVQINKCQLEEKVFEYNMEFPQLSVEKVRNEVLKFLLVPSLGRDLEYSISLIEKNLSSLALPSNDIFYIEKRINNYKKMTIDQYDKSDNYEQTSRVIANILGLDKEVEELVKFSLDNKALSKSLKGLIYERNPYFTEVEILALSQHLMKNMTIRGQGLDMEKREQIYKSWVEDKWGELV